MFPLERSIVNKEKTKFDCRFTSTNELESFDFRARLRSTIAKCSSNQEWRNQRWTTILNNKKSWTLSTSIEQTNLRWWCLWSRRVVPNETVSFLVRTRSWFLGTLLDIWEFVSGHELRVRRREETWTINKRLILIDPSDRSSKRTSSPKTAKERDRNRRLVNSSNGTWNLSWFLRRACSTWTKTFVTT